MMVKIRVSWGLIIMSLSTSGSICLSIELSALRLSWDLIIVLYETIIVQPINREITRGNGCLPPYTLLTLNWGNFSPISTPTRKTPCSIMWGLSLNSGWMVSILKKILHGRKTLNLFRPSSSGPGYLDKD